MSVVQDHPIGRIAGRTRSTGRSDSLPYYPPSNFNGTTSVLSGQWKPESLLLPRAGWVAGSIAGCQRIRRPLTRCSRRPPSRGQSRPSSTGCVAALQCLQLGFLRLLEPGWRHPSLATQQDQHTAPYCNFELACPPPESPFIRTSTTRPLSVPLSYRLRPA